MKKDTVVGRPVKVWLLCPWGNKADLRQGDSLCQDGDPRSATPSLADGWLGDDERDIVLRLPMFPRACVITMAVLSRGLQPLPILMMVGAAPNPSPFLTGADPRSTGREGQPALLNPRLDLDS
jgi:hypothetical protein